MVKSPNKICYVLTSNAKDNYANMNLLSIWSLQYSTPSLHIILLCDTDTMIALKQKKHPILDYVNEIISINTPVGTADFRNRYIKTSMHRYINGPFLYLDADTLVRRNINQIFFTSASFSAAANHSGNGDPSEIPDRELSFFKEMNWPIPKKFINGGVLYFSDQHQACRLGEVWHQKWRDFSSRTGKHYDQNALNSALDECGTDFEWMDPLCNAQLMARPYMACDARVWHFYSSDNQVAPKTIFDLALKKLAKKEMKKYELFPLIQREHPYLINNSIDRLAVKNIIYKNQILKRQNWEFLWLSGNYTGACKAIIRSFKRIAFNP